MIGAVTYPNQNAKLFVTDIPHGAPESYIKKILQVVYAFDFTFYSFYLNFHFFPRKVKQQFNATKKNFYDAELITYTDLIKLYELYKKRDKIYVIYSCFSDNYEPILYIVNDGFDKQMIKDTLKNYLDYQIKNNLVLPQPTEKILFDCLVNVKYSNLIDNFFRKPKIKYSEFIKHLDKPIFDLVADIVFNRL